MTDDATRRLPLVCVDWQLADAFCRWAGGSLPSEPQWLFAATGRDRGTRYPWGSELPSCAAPSLADWPACGPDNAFPYAVDARPRDVSLEGIVDLAGGVAEILADVPGVIDDLIANAAGAELIVVAAESGADTTVYAAGSKAIDALVLLKPYTPSGTRHFASATVSQAKPADVLRTLEPRAHEQLTSVA